MPRGGGRDKSVTDHINRFEEKERRSGWGIAPPSRHLWVGNLNPHVSESDISEQFLRFGNIDNISYLPGRNYAFVNFMKEEDAIIAMRGLQGSILAGFPLRIEFAKGDKHSVLSRDDEFPKRNDERYSIEREDELRRDLRAFHESSDKSYEKAKGNKNAEPSEVLWIGFPAFLNVEEAALRRAFSPFGEIEEVSTFPGRSYAFVRYRSIVSACRAKEALQGKLFNNPRVHICFSRNEFTSADHERNPRDPSFASHSRSFSNLDSVSGDASFPGLGRSTFVKPSAVPGSKFGAFGHDRVEELGMERRMSEDLYERYKNSPATDRGGKWHEIPFERSRRTPLYEDSWGMDDGSFPVAKKQKADSFPDKDLPEYPFSDLEQKKHDYRLPKLFPTVADSSIAYYNRSFDSVSFGLKGISDHLRNPVRSLAESDESLKTFDKSDSGSGPLASNRNIMHRVSSEPHQPSRNEEWKWEGTIAKGGTPVCRARCFPVGKVLDFMLPEFLNCTAKTDLDMLAKHYYQAANSWVVFFVPETDGDIAPYNEFMNFMGEKQRAAVAKLGERGTLFLVPPSDFSEKVLKVPGKLSISGVILKFQQSISNLSSTQNPPEIADPKMPLSVYQPKDVNSLGEDASSGRPYSPDYRAFSQGQNHFSLSSGHLVPGTYVFPPLPPLPPPLQRTGDNVPFSGSVLPMDKLPEYAGLNRQDQLQPQNFPLLLPKLSNQVNIPSSTSGSLPSPPSSATSHLVSNSTPDAYPVVNTKVAHGSSSSIYAPETMTALPSNKFPLHQEYKPPVPTSIPLPLQPEQLVQLSDILGRSTAKESDSFIDRENKQSNLLSNPNMQAQTSHGQTRMPNVQPSVPHSYASTPSTSLDSHISQTQQYQQTVPAVLPVGNPGLQGNQQAANNSREDTEGDTQKRLQATLQLAAALLQQIQQQSKTGDQH